VSVVRPGSDPNLRLRQLLTRASLLVREVWSEVRPRWWLVAVTVLVGAGAAAALAAYGPQRLSPANRTYEARAVFSVADNPLVYKTGYLAVPKVADPDGMQHQLELASRPAAYSRVAADLDLPLEIVRSSITVGRLPREVRELGASYTQSLVFDVRLRGEKRVRSALQSMIRSYRAARRREFSRELGVSHRYLLAHRDDPPGSTATTPPVKIRRIFRRELRAVDHLRAGLPLPIEQVSFSVNPAKQVRGVGAAAILGGAVGLLIAFFVIFMPQVLRRRESYESQA
jgi:hypothetical protein